MKLFFDTETTGKADMRSSTTANHQPHIVQLAVMLTDDDGTERASMNVIIKPVGWEIPKEASDIHGITTETAERCGVQLGSAMALFSNLLAVSGELIAHNIDFDTFVSQVALHRLGTTGIKGSFTCAERLEKIEKFCTMKRATDVCKLPGQYGFKWPKLTEAYMHFFGAELVGAHDAMTDLRACKAVYFSLKGLSNDKA